jgi:hypothetical protein
MACPFCGHFGGYAGSPGYEPGDDDYAQAKRAAELLARVADWRHADDTFDEAEREEIRGMVRGLFRPL